MNRSLKLIESGPAEFHFNMVVGKIRIQPQNDLARLLTRLTHWKSVRIEDLHTIEALGIELKLIDQNGNLRPLEAFQPGSFDPK